MHPNLPNGALELIPWGSTLEHVQMKYPALSAYQQAKEMGLAELGNKWHETKFNSAFYFSGTGGLRSIQFHTPLNQDRDLTLKPETESTPAGQDAE